MKKIILAIVFIFIGSFSLLKAQPYYNAGVSYGVFYNELSPYGTWIQINDGTVVWKPQIIQPGWAPYTDGRWVWTADGWYWDSYEPFGYIVYHYGRWYYDNYYGWIWVPDDQWAPAWVEWRYDNDYIGWAPLPPYAGFSVSAGINFSINYVSPYRFWRFVAFNHFCDPYVYHYYVPSRNIYGIYAKTAYRTNYSFENGRVINRGVDVNIIRNRSGRTITETKIRVVSNPAEIRANNSNTKNRNELRAFVATREELSANPSRNVVIQRGRERSSLDVNKVQINRSSAAPRVIGHDQGNVRNVPEVNSRNEQIRIQQRNQSEINNRVPQNESPIIIRRNVPNTPPQEKVREQKVDRQINTNKQIDNNRQIERQRPNVQRSAQPQPRSEIRNNSQRSSKNERQSRRR
jgi:hypothetical protein